MMNENGPRNLGRHFKNRLVRVEERFQNKFLMQEYRKKTVTLYRRDNPQTNALAHLPLLAPYLDSVLVDQEGYSYLLRWQRAKIPPGYEILGSRPQSGRDYAANPPKTRTPVRLIYACFPKGIDVLQRGICEILDSYLVGRDTPAEEVEQVKKVLSRLLVLKGHINSFSELSGQDLDQIVNSNITFLEENGFLNSKSPEKQKIQELMARGFRDSLGRKNYLAALTRIYRVELAVVKRNATITRILEKYSGMLAVVELTRDSTRFALQEAEKKLGELLEDGAFTTPDFGNFPREVWIGKARTIWCELRDMTNSLVRNAEVRPYVLVYRKAIEHFGTIDLPEGTISARVQKSRKERGIPTITDYLRTGDFESASQLIGKVRLMIKGHWTFMQITKLLSYPEKHATRLSNISPQFPFSDRGRREGRKNSENLNILYISEDICRFYLKKPSIDRSLTTFFMNHKSFLSIFICFGNILFLLSKLFKAITFTTFPL